MKRHEGGLDPLELDDDMVRVARSLAERRAGLPAVLAAVRAPDAFLRVAGLVLRLPSLEVIVRASCPAAAHEVMAPRPRRPFPRRRFAQAVLQIPEDGYTRGRHRQAMRTNARHARGAGTSVEVVAGERAVAVITSVLEHTKHSPYAHERLQSLARSPHAATWAALTADGQPLGFTTLVLARPWARLVASVSHRDGATRWLLHVQVVEQLRALEYSHLTVGSGLVELAGTRHFQSLTGFRIFNLRVGNVGTDDRCSCARDRPGVPPASDGGVPRGPSNGRRTA